MSADRAAIRARQELNERTVDALLSASADADASKIAACSTAWAVDRYDKAKILDVISVNRCKHRLCAHCAHIRSARSAARVAAAVTAGRTAHPGLYWYALTITKTSGHDLKSELAAITRAYDKLYKTASDPRTKSKPIDIQGAIRGIEITHGKAGWHAHIHAIIASASPPDGVERIRYNGVLHTDQEVEIGRYIASAVNDAAPHTECRLQPISDAVTAAREIAKYMTKLDDVAKLPAPELRELLQNTNGRRMIQGRGILYHMPAVDNDLTPDLLNAVERLARAKMTERPSLDAIDLAGLLTVYHDYEVIAIPAAAKNAALAAAARCYSQTPADLQELLQEVRRISDELRSIHLDMKQPAAQQTSYAVGG